MEKIITQVVEVKYLTMKVVELHVKLVAPDIVKFHAGQFMQFDAHGYFRAYSISNPPTGLDSTLTFCIELIDGGVGSEFVRKLKPGDEVKMRGPLGVFGVKQKDLERDMVFVATGVGIAPFVSIISDLLARGYLGNIFLLYGLRNEENVFYYDKFNKLAKMHSNFKFVPILSKPESHWPGEMGRVTTYVEVHYSEFRDRLFYLCGSKEMVADVRDILIKNNHNTKDIHLEIF
jgi:ferredoxin-NADP reductase